MPLRLAIQSTVNETSDKVCRCMISGCSIEIILFICRSRGVARYDGSEESKVGSVYIRSFRACPLGLELVRTTQLIPLLDNILQRFRFATLEPVVE